ncbi:restriction endonuclease [Enterovirga rhinocerotis]|uniref:Restriction endonuclease PvuII n=1 Tax=Enterovirga rhinocerotis TaxID=1339210 RepID=A0A4R7BM34_9HYPH|nr:restriction endonuclease [Enterovirga rhinocerotis]TDR85325.1 restriction endonuclease PvuII [Enterovirga rhinocerotis]
MATKRHAEWERLQKLLPAVLEYQKLATEHGINDIFQDNGGKILQMLFALNLQGLPGREGNDAVDADGLEYELKSVNIALTPNFSTHHHINPTILAKYKQVGWYFAVFQDIEMRRIYHVGTDKLAAIFDQWEKKWHGSGGKDINNPKIPLTFVMENGTEVYEDGKPFDPSEAAKLRAARKREAARIKAEADERAGKPPVPRKTRGRLPKK